MTRKNFYGKEKQQMNSTTVFTGNALSSSPPKKTRKKQTENVLN